MSSNGHGQASSLRARLHHPIIDADGHWLEFGPVVREQLKRIGGDRAVEGFSLFGAQVAKELAMSVAERRAHRIAQQAFWALPTRNTAISPISSSLRGSRAPRPQEPLRIAS